jgi:transmembrane sensor
VNALTADIRRAEAASPDEAAAFWDSRLRSPLCTEEDRAAFAAWREREPANAAAFERLQGGIGALHDAFAASAELRAMHDRAMEVRPAPQWGRMPAGVAAAITLGVGGWWATTARPPAPADSGLQVASGQGSFHQTGVGELSTVTLSDGSKVTLNTRSRLEVNYTADRRTVKLISGQALFEVAKNKTAPFRVYAGDRAITAVGTVFDVRLDGAKVKVALVEGHVRVAPVKPVVAPGAPAQRVDLAAGEVLEAEGPAPMLVAAADVRRVVTWRSGLVEFSGEPLVVAVAEMNRYTDHPLRIADPDIAGVRVSGIFRTSEPELFAHLISQVAPITAERAPDGSTVLRGRTD